MHIYSVSEYNNVVAINRKVLSVRLIYTLLFHHQSSVFDSVKVNRIEFKNHSESATFLLLNYI